VIIEVGIFIRVAGSCTLTIVYFAQINIHIIHRRIKPSQLASILLGLLALSSIETLSHLFVSDLIEYITKTASNIKEIIPSCQVNCQSQIKAINNPDDIKNSGKSTSIRVALTLRVQTAMAEIPHTSNTFVIFDPITLSIAKFEFHSNTQIIEVASSGRLHHTATIVAQIMKLESQK